MLVRAYPHYAGRHWGIIAAIAVRSLHFRRAQILFVLFTTNRALGKIVRDIDNSEDTLASNEFSETARGSADNGCR